MSNSCKTLIVGVGNRYRSDDGIGPVIIDQLKAKKFNQGILLDAATDGLALLDIIKDYDKVLLIDAVNFKAPPGTIKIFSKKNAKLTIHSDSLSTHGFGISEMILLAEKLAIKTEITIIGIQPFSLDMKEGLSAEVANKVPEIIALIEKL